ncbi:MAG: hypothetical protein VKQ33_03830 [Candidatus Sericytochromatia bacterium]|nr:hypothetical protein [Candidatus Sericytochromatia bacterium]
MPTDPQPEITVRTLRQALAFFLEDDNLIDRLEAESLKELLLRDGQVTSEEKAFLQNAITTQNFDARALDILKSLLG